MNIVVLTQFQPSRKADDDISPTTIYFNESLGYKTKVASLTTLS